LHAFALGFGMPLQQYLADAKSKHCRGKHRHCDNSEISYGHKHPSAPGPGIMAKNAPAS
jgi:hypothetical protein